MTENDSEGIGGPCDSCASIAPALVMVEAHLHPEGEEAHLCRTCYDELAADSPLLPVLDDIVESAVEVDGTEPPAEEDTETREPAEDAAMEWSDEETAWGERPDEGEWHEGDTEQTGDADETDNAGE